MVKSKTFELQVNHITAEQVASMQNSFFINHGDFMKSNILSRSQAQELYNSLANGRSALEMVGTCYIVARELQKLAQSSRLQYGVVGRLTTNEPLQCWSHWWIECEGTHFDPWGTAAGVNFRILLQLPPGDILNEFSLSYEYLIRTSADINEVIRKALFNTRLNTPLKPRLGSLVDIINNASYE